MISSTSDYLLAALTGSMGSGKSTAARYFKEAGAEIIDADTLARQAVELGSSALSQITQTFGSDYLLPDGSLDRKRLGTLVFNNKESRLKLEAIVHPEVRKLFLQQKEAFELKRSPAQRLLLYVIPLYYESSYRHPEIKKVIVVSAPFELCVARIVARDGCDRDVAVQKLQTQIPIEEKEAQADFVLNNSGTTEQLKESVYALYKTILQNLEITK